MQFLVLAFGGWVLLGLAGVGALAGGVSAFAQVRGVSVAPARCLGVAAGLLGPAALVALLRAISPAHSTPWALLFPAAVCAVAWSVDQRSKLRRHRQVRGVGMAPDVPEHERGLW